MSFVYSDVLSTNRDKVRFRVGDTQQGRGPRPDKLNSNFSDEEITFVLSEESTVNATIAHLFEILANEWAAYAINEREGETSMDATKTADEFRKQASIWRKKPGGASEAENSGGMVTITRSDAWGDSDDTEYS